MMKRNITQTNHRKQVQNLTSIIQKCLIVAQQNELHVVHPEKSHNFKGINLFIPKARLHTRQFPVWFTSQMHHSLKCLCALQRKLTPSNLEKAQTMLPMLLLNQNMNKILCVILLPIRTPGTLQRPGSFPHDFMMAPPLLIQMRVIQ